MGVKLNHIVIDSNDKTASAEFLAKILGVGPPTPYGHFVTVEVSNEVSLDFDNADEVHSQHYAFLVDDADFDPIFERVTKEGITYYADPSHREPGVINTLHTGRGFYFNGPEGHNLEVITRPYGTT